MKYRTALQKFNASKFLQDAPEGVYKKYMTEGEIQKNAAAIEFLKRCKGFSLLELTVVIIIISFIMSSIVFTTQARLDATRIFITKERMQTVMDGIDRYVENYGHMPCPANPSILRTDPNYGWGTGTNSGGANCLQAATFYTSGGANGDIVMGMVPFKTLVPPLDSSIAIDGWGNRFSYFVTEIYTNRANYRDLSAIGNNYVISSQANGVSSYNFVDSTNGDVAYILLSHGPNGAYAYRDKDGTQISITAPSDADTENGVGNNYGVPINDAQFVVRMPDSTNDDILLYKNKWQLPDYINE